MAVGGYVTQKVINDRIFQLCITARNLALSIDQLLVNTQGKTQAELLNIPQGGSPEIWTAADVTALTAAAAVLIQVRNAAQNGKAAFDKMTGAD